MNSRFEPVRMIREGSGPPLVLLHCLGVDHHFWDFAAPLSAEFTLYRYDLPGHGASATPPAGYGIADLSEQLAGLLAEHKTGRVHLAGISLGGLIAQHFAATHPELVDRLILIDTTPRYTDEMRSMWAERAAGARQAGSASLIEGLLKIWFTPAAIARNGADVQYVRSTISKCSGEGYALACEALAAADLREPVGTNQGADAGHLRRRRHPELSGRSAAACHRRSAAQRCPGSLRRGMPRCSNSLPPACG